MDFTLILFFKWHEELDSANIPILVTTNYFTLKHEEGCLGTKWASPCFKCIKGHWENDFPMLK